MTMKDPKQGKSYKIVCERGPDGYILRLKGKPSIEVRDVSLEEAKHEMHFQIMEKYGDCENVLDVYNKEDDSDSSLIWSPQTSQKLTTTNSSDLYEGDACSICHRRVGPRVASVSRVVAEKLKNDIGYSIALGSTVQLISDRFCQLLLSLGMPQLFVIQGQAKQGQKIWEFNVNQARLSRVAISGYEKTTSGVKCAGCGVKFLSCIDPEDDSLRGFVVSKMWTEIGQNITLLGSSLSVELVVSNSIKNKIVSEGILGIRWEKYRLVDDDIVNSKVRYSTIRKW